MLSHLLSLAGIDSVVVDNRTTARARALRGRGRIAQHPVVRWKPAFRGCGVLRRKGRRSVDARASEPWLGAGRPAVALEHLTRVFDRNDPAFHEAARFMSITYLADAASQSGQRHVAVPILDDLEARRFCRSGARTGHAARAAPPLFACGMPARAALVVLP